MTEERLNQLIQEYEEKPPRKETNAEKAEALHKKVKRVPLLICFGLGIFAILLFGTGLSFILGAIELDMPMTGIWLGVVFGTVSAVPLVLNPVIYKKLKSFMQERYRGEIQMYLERARNDLKLEKDTQGDLNAWNGKP